MSKEMDGAFHWWYNNLTGRPEPVPAPPCELFSSILTAEDCVFLWDCGIRADEDIVQRLTKIKSRLRFRDW